MEKCKKLSLLVAILVLQYTSVYVKIPASFKAKKNHNFQQKTFYTTVLEIAPLFEIWTFSAGILRQLFTVRLRIAQT